MTSLDLGAAGPVRLARGANAPLTAAVPGLRQVIVGMGWITDPGLEIDAQVILLGADGRVASPGDLLFTWQLAQVGQIRDAAGAASTGPASTGPASTAPAGEDTEQVLVDLAAVPGDVARLMLSAAIYDAVARRQSFAQVRRAHVRVVDADSGRELARHDLIVGDAAGADGGRETAMVFGELYRHAGGWKVRAIGQGYAGGLAAVARDVGVDR